ncbi:MAG TPA: RNA polymerase sigma-54 factor, partial [candidate division Zixibacteria bacterium]|nr:RNA polymerase sigma-54 factor [candidate division Zixibacteria bacterium]
DNRLQTLGEFIIGNLDEKGFLGLSDEELLCDAERLDLLDPPPTLNEVGEAVSLVQSFNPSGIAARSLQECFLIQLFDRDEVDTTAWRLIHDYFEELKNKNIPQLADLMGTTIADIESAMLALGSLSFAPAADYTGQAGGSIDPDLIVEKVQGRWIVRYNGAGIPELRINNHYRGMLKQRTNLEKDAKKFLSKKLNSAQWWIQSLQQRKDTMVRTMRAILHHQFPFFENGPGNLLPLKMEEIASEVDVHPATISRVVRDKYVQTPYGVFPLRHFFGGGLATDTGEDIATTNVKQQIKAIIGEEDSAAPFADQKITEMLNEKGIQIARRTVAKYREELGLPTARMRKRKRK